MHYLIGVALIIKKSVLCQGYALCILNLIQTVQLRKHVIASAITKTRDRQCNNGNTWLCHHDFNSLLIWFPSYGVCKICRIRSNTSQSNNNSVSWANIEKFKFKKHWFILYHYFHIFRIILHYYINISIVLL